MKAAVYIVDDDEAIRDALGWLFRSRQVDSYAWTSGEAFLADWNKELLGCLVLDVRMEGMSGLQLFDLLCERGSRLPVVFLSGHGDIPLAVAAIKRGAADFVEKPFDDNELVDRVIRIIEADTARKPIKHDHTEISHRLAQLTPREREVMERILSGKYNKVIAEELGIAMRTVEVHRSRIFEKIGVKSAVELARLLTSLG